MNENGPDSRDYTSAPCERSSFWFLNALIYHNYRSYLYSYISPSCAGAQLPVLRVSWIYGNFEQINFISGKMR